MKKFKIITGAALLIALTILVSLYVYNAGEEKMIKKSETTFLKSVNVKEVPKTIKLNNKLSSSKIDNAVKAVNTKKAANKKSKKKVVIDKKTKKAKVVKSTNNKNVKKIGTFRCTAYCGCGACCGGGSGRTASGTTPTAGRTIATDPSVIPLGSKVVINGHTYVAEDTGGAINGNVIDVFFASHSEAFQQYYSAFCATTSFPS